MNLPDKFGTLVEERVVKLDKAYMLQQSAYPMVGKDEKLQKLLQNENNPDFVVEFRFPLIILRNS